jgi:hypothetical protein
MDAIPLAATSSDFISLGICTFSMNGALRATVSVADVPGAVKHALSLM